MQEKQLVEYLKGACPGRACIAKGTELEAALHVSGNELRKMVNRLRRRGVPIASSREGYFYAVNAGEVYATIRQLQSMVRGLEGAISGLEKALEGFCGDEE